MASHVSHRPKSSHSDKDRTKIRPNPTKKLCRHTFNQAVQEYLSVAKRYQALSSDPAEKFLCVHARQNPQNHLEIRQKCVKTTVKKLQISRNQPSAIKTLQEFQLPPSNLRLKCLKAVAENQPNQKPR